jgi:hypothetical protein
MKVNKQISALLLATTLSLASAATGHAKSSLISLSDEPLWPTSCTPDGNLVYMVTTIGRAGSGLLSVSLTASNLPPGAAVTFSPSVLKFTGNQAVAQTARMTVSCSAMTPIDCYPFTITATSQRETITITNPVCYSPQALAVRTATLMLDCLTNSALMVRGAGATAKTYQIEASADVANPVWTPLGPTTADANGRFIFPTSQSMPMRFFRAVTTGEPVANP